MGTPPKRPPRYDRRFLLRALSDLEKENRLGRQAALVFAEPGTPSDNLQDALAWLNLMLGLVFQGISPDFDPFDALVITDKTPEDDQRRLIWDFAQQTFVKLQAHN